MTATNCLRSVMSRFATGVTVVGARHPRTEELLGMTANAVCSVSLDPPLVLVCVARKGRTHDAIAEAGSFSINVLSESQRDVSEVFATSSRADKFAEVPHELGPAGTPLIVGALACLECTVWAAYPGGDHTIYVGRVDDARIEEEAAEPLVFFGGSYETLPRRDALVSSGN